MSDPLKNLSDALAQIKPHPEVKSEKIYMICGVALFCVWGLVSSALLFNTNLWDLDSALLRSIICIVFAGLLPVAIHLYEVQVGKTRFEWKTVFISLTFGGIPTLFLGSILQAILLSCGVHSLFGLQIDTWYWKFPITDINP